MLGTDVRSASATTLATIGNAEAIAIDQDALGVQGFQVSVNGSAAPAVLDGLTLVNVSACPPPARTAWALRADARIEAAGGAGCLTVYDCGTAPGTPVGTFACVNNSCANQLWDWQGPRAGGRVAARGAPGLCLTALDADAAPLSDLVAAPCAPAAAASQTWALDETSGELSLPLAAPAALCAWQPAPPPVSVYMKPLAPRKGAQPVAVAVLNRGDAALGPQVSESAALAPTPTLAAAAKGNVTVLTHLPYTHAERSHFSPLLNRCFSSATLDSRPRRASSCATSGKMKRPHPQSEPTLRDPSHRTRRCCSYSRPSSEAHRVALLARLARRAGALC
jgi:hypothetical protein